MNFVEQEPSWQPLEMSNSSTLPEASLMESSLEYTLRTISHSPHTAADYKLDPYDTFASDCILTPVSLEGGLDMPFSDSTSLPWPTPYPQDCDHPSACADPNMQDVAKGMRKERRRAQNRKAQKAFRERKDKAIQRLEEEVEKLNKINQSLSTANEARLREISELKTELEERLSISSSPRRDSYFEGWEGVTSKRGSVSSDRTSILAAPTPIVPVETADVCGPFIKWRGKVYIDAESFLKRQPKECG